MVITIIGWYGTETIGDRAILAGLFNLLSNKTHHLAIKLGSLYPDFTKRTILEDYDFYTKISNNAIHEITIFDSLCPKELKTAIKCSDLVAIGGGPLMDIVQMYMLNYAFKFARKNKIKTAILGCGWGPLKNPEYQNIASSIIGNADIAVFRDSISLNQYHNHCSNNCKSNVVSSIDPAFFCAEYYKKSLSTDRSNNFIAINFRDVSLDQYDGSKSKNEAFFLKLLNDILESSNLPIKLIPMHSFFIGGDDRSILNRLAMQLQNKRVEVINDPPSLTEVMSLYYNAAFCIGMRFHSIVLQTVLNGKNYILDYTDSKKGKIISMMQEIGMLEDYKTRYISLSEDISHFSVLSNISRYEISDSTFIHNRKIWEDQLEKVI